MKNLNRRSFLKSTALSAAALGWTAKSWSQIPGANGDVRIAVIGFNGRGQNHIDGYKKITGARLVALCDVDKKVLDRGVQRLQSGGGEISGYTDIRKLLEDKNVDAVSIATPNHWHSLAGIWSVQAGKDVYVEKPISHNVWEGRQLVNAARKYNKIVQAGTQSRSSIHGIKAAVEWVREGNLGKILVARGLCYKPRASIGKAGGEQPIPDSVDYDLWCGPAEKVPLTRKKLHYDWHWVWNTGCGDLGNQGIHQMDIARWFLGETTLAPRVWSVGGRLGYDDDGETPNTQIVYQDYEKAPLIFEVRGLPKSKEAQGKGWGAKDMDKFPVEHGDSVSVTIHCENGHIQVPNYLSAIAYDKDEKEIMRWPKKGESDKGDDGHYGNFLKAVRSRKTSDLNADILEGHLSSALCHTSNISYRLGAKKSPGEIREKIKGDKDALPTFERMVEHLKANEVNLDMDKATLGVVLKMDVKSEKFPGQDEANALLTRKYRAPFIVPEKV